MQASAPDFKQDSVEDMAFPKVLVISLAFHIIVLIIIPVVSKMFSRPVKFERPKTFQLVQIPLPPAPPPKRVPVEQPAPEQHVPKPEVRPEPKPVPAEKPTPKPVEQKPVEKPKVQEEARRAVVEDLDELASLLSELPASTQVSAPSDFKQHWYINNIRSKIEQFWSPHLENRNLSVIVQFFVNSDGSVSNVSISKSSGNSTLDNLGIRAVTLAAPFGRLPPGFTGNQLDLSVTLIPTTRK